MPAPIFHDQPPDAPLAEVARCPRLRDARERGLVLAAMDIPYWLLRHGREYGLIVLEKDRAPALAALAAFERDELSRPAPLPIEPLRIPAFAVFLTLCLMVLLHLLQSAADPATIERGIADSTHIRAGQWWRTVTALTLHGDTAHLVSNLSLALFVFAFVLSHFGTGFGLLATLLGGAAGNALNATLHLGTPHRSIGSSTALFAGLGLLAGAELAARLARRGTSTGRPLLIPIGAGLAFLALFGSGPGGTPAGPGGVDLGAHLLGLLAGIALGAAFTAAGLKNDAPRAWRAAAAAAAALLPALCWHLALR